MGDAQEPSDEDWTQAALMVLIVDALGDKSFRATMRELASDLERFGLAAHRSADVREGRSYVPRVHTKDVPIWEHTRAAILTKLEAKYTWRHFLPIGLALEQLDHAEAPDGDALRRQAAKLLDAALLVEELLRWHEIRSEIVGADDLVNDTIVAIMLDWNYVKHAETAKQIGAQLRARNLNLTTALTAERLKTALSRHRTRLREAHAAGQNETAGPFSPPLRSILRPKATQPTVTSEG